MWRALLVYTPRSSETSIFSLQHARTHISTHIHILSCTCARTNTDRHFLSHSQTLSLSPCVTQAQHTNRKRKRRTNNKTKQKTRKRRGRFIACRRRRARGWEYLKAVRVMHECRFYLKAAATRTSPGAYVFMRDETPLYESPRDHNRALHRSLYTRGHLAPDAR